jgi:hypothetical protein
MRRIPELPSLGDILPLPQPYFDPARDEIDEIRRLRAFSNVMRDVRSAYECDNDDDRYSSALARMIESTLKVPLSNDDPSKPAAVAAMRLVEIDLRWTLAALLRAAEDSGDNRPIAAYALSFALSFQASKNQRAILHGMRFASPSPLVRATTTLLLRRSKNHRQYVISIVIQILQACTKILA